MDVPSLPSLVDTERWQRLQDHFADVLGIPIRTVSPARELLFSPSWPPALPVDPIVKSFKMGQWVEQLVPADRVVDHTASFTTPLGATFSAVPVRVTAEQIVGYFIVGPMVVGKREDEQAYRDRMTSMGLDADAMWTALISLRLRSFTAIRSMLNLLEEVGTSLVQFAYQVRRLEALVPASSKIDQAVMTYYTDRILHSLLEAATLATRAEGGSVMLHDARRNALTIRVAEGLSEEMVTHTSVPPGEGLAGLAMTRREVLLVDEKTTDEELTQRMRRPKLRSSLVAPLVPERLAEPIGVLNLRTSQRERKFTDEHVAVLQRLLELAGIALGGLRVASAATTSK